MSGVLGLSKQEEMEDKGPVSERRRCSIMFDTPSRLDAQRHAPLGEKRSIVLRFTPRTQPLRFPRA